MSEVSKTLESIEGIGNYEYGWSDKDLAGASDRKSTRLNSSHEWISRMPSSA